MIRAALLHLGVGFTIGALMLANKGIAFAPWVWRLLGAHIELLVVGWMIQLALGVAFWSLPRFTGPRRYGRVELGWLAAVLLNGGVIVSAVGNWAGSSVAFFAGRVAVLVSVALFVAVLWPRVKPLAVAPVKRDETQISSQESI
jgi:hypothetical protein